MPPYPWYSTYCLNPYDMKLAPLALQRKWPHRGHSPWSGGHDRKISCFPHVGQWKSQRSTWNCWLVSFPTWIWEEFLLKRGKIMDISPAAFQLGIKTVPNKNRLVENVLDIEFGLCKYLRMFACLWLEKNGRMRWLTRWEQDMVKTTCEPTRNTHEH